MTTRMTACMSTRMTTRMSIAAAVLLLATTLTACNIGGDDDCDTESLAPVAAVQAIPGRSSGGTSGGSRSGSKPRPSVQKPATPPKHGNTGHITGTTGGHTHHDYDDCDDD